MATQYRFKTVIVTDEYREQFTKFRDQFDGVRVTDKELFEAVWELVDKESLKKQILEMKQTKTKQSELEKIKKLEAKLKEKLEKLQTKDVVETEEKKKKAAK